MDLAVRERVAGDRRRLDRPRERPRDVDAYDGLGAVGQASLEDRLEVPRARRRRLRERGIRGGHATPELLGRQVEPGLVMVVPEAHLEGDDGDAGLLRGIGRQVRGGVGHDGDAAHDSLPRSSPPPAGR